MSLTRLRRHVAGQEQRRKSPLWTRRRPGLGFVGFVRVETSARKETAGACTRMRAAPTLAFARTYGLTFKYIIITMHAGAC